MSFNDVENTMVHTFTILTQPTGWADVQLLHKYMVTDSELKWYRNGGYVSSLVTIYKGLRTIFNLTKLQVRY